MPLCITDFTISFEPELYYSKREIAAECGVDPSTVENWISSTGRMVRKTNKIFKKGKRVRLEIGRKRNQVRYFLGKEILFFLWVTGRSEKKPE